LVAYGPDERKTFQLLQPTGRHRDLETSPNSITFCLKKEHNAHIAQQQPRHDDPDDMPWLLVQKLWNLELVQIAIAGLIKSRRRMLQNLKTQT
jgi:hypothetical protein